MKSIKYGTCQSHPCPCVIHFYISLRLNLNYSRYKFVYHFIIHITKTWLISLEQFSTTRNTLMVLYRTKRRWSKCPTDDISVDELSGVWWTAVAAFWYVRVSPGSIKGFTWLENFIQRIYKVDKTILSKLMDTLITALPCEVWVNNQSKNFHFTLTIPYLCY